MITAAGQRILVVIAAAHADQLIHFVVIRSNVFVSNRPRNLPSIALRARKIEVGIAQRHSSPDVSLAATAPHPNQIEGLSGWSAERSSLQVHVELRRALSGSDL